MTSFEAVVIDVCSSCYNISAPGML